ncbi:NifU family protein [Paucihalobacter ruber]|uniref:NifU family protein n=1 Tax=Paucihalobacter ruber TaxID=2567861 RepID=A0A506PRB8_9FLAO|nr:NifU family protein [Paucihalobacter ruber]TPV35827.1 NifU family protein [Paucihalobacter ruber]
MSITIKPTNRETILKFETEQFLVNAGSFQFNNIDEAKNSPLSQQLFYLPFVKKVFISSNFIAIERYDIVEWKDVQEEVANQIAAYIKSGQPIIDEKTIVKKTAVTVYAESTPNPGVLKFVANKKLVPVAMEFNNIDESKYSPLAMDLFQFPFVKSLFFEDNFIAISKYDIADWNDITIELREFIRNYIESGKRVLEDEALSQLEEKEQKTTVENINLDITSKEIIKILEEYVKPAVASDGGNIEFKSYNSETHKVSVLLQGACSGCPSSTFTLKNGIETMLKEMLNNQNLTVEALNG